MDKDSYNYSAADESVLSPWIYRFLVNPLMKVLPRSIPANMITLFGFLFIIASFLTAYINYLKNTERFLFLIPLFCLCYLVCDCSDGVQARRTNTCSPLGEYFDHFLDSFVTGLLTGTLLLTYRISHPLVLICTYHFLYFGQMATFDERLMTGTMRFGKISTSEGTLGLAIACAMKPLFPYVGALPMLGGLRIAELIFLLCFFFSFLAGLKAVIRLHSFSLKLFFQMLLSVFTAAVLVYGVHISILYLTFIVSFYNVLFIQSILSATNQKAPVSWPDILAPTSAAVLIFLPEYACYAVPVLIGYLAVRIAVRVVLFFRHYKTCWYWVNP